MFSALANSACNATTLSSATITGRVIAADTKAPLANTYVTARWDVESGSVSGHGLFCVRSAAVQTDANGHFRLAAWERKGANAVIFYADLDAYHAGYVTAVRDIHLTGDSHFFTRTLELRPQDLVIEMKPFEGGQAERADQLALFIQRTVCQRPYMTGLHSLYEAIYGEAKDLPTPPVDPGQLGLQSWLLDLMRWTEERPKNNNSGDPAK